ncbi:hypothetical protein TSAR_014040 [Trichomalopsis sarcophagae]|uniref:DnaJ homolog subfamily C member 21 n=1 Tax=Trichomalopsis sarcophagae TaxID=543379 RepID=A0A232EUZ3_9HYME|nr:hypothetical protein TSAR_014040 [Trichomalopsis sarcophagae]
MKCHYEVLELPRNASDDEIKKAYRKLALRWHPDKNLDNPDEAKEQFQLVQQAYEVLSDPHERAWYDNHREAILKGGIGDDYKDDSIDLFQYFSSTCFKGYGDDEKGFYAVYRHVFEKLAAEDAEFSKEGDSDEEVPDFGDSTSSYEDVVHKFYAYWQSYTTKRSFAWLEPYNIRDAPNRYALRQMEKENKKIRDKAKKERNEQVRNLVAFVRKRDKRVQAHAKKLEEKSKENKRKMEERKKQQLLERQKELKEHKESEWSKFSNIQSELKNIEASLAAEFGEELSSDEEKESDLEDSNALYCVACTKLFKTQKAFSNHENSKKHKDNVAALKASMVEDDIDGSTSSSDDSQDGDSEKGDWKATLPPGTKLATGTDMPDFLLNPPAKSNDTEEKDAKTSDEEKDSESESNSKSSKASKSKKNQKSSGADTSISQGYILGKSDDTNKEDGYQSDTPDEELLSDQEDEVVVKPKKQKKKKNKNARMSILEDSDDDDKEVDLLMGLSKKQRKKQQQQKILMDKLSSSKSQTPDNVDKDNDNSASLSVDGSQAKAEESDDDSPQETVSPLPGKKKGKKAKELRKAQRQAAGEARETNDRTRKASKSADLEDKDLDHTCAACKQEFSSKNKLFDHLKKTGHSMYIPNVTKVKKSVDRTAKGKGRANKNSDD